MPTEPRRIRKGHDEFVEVVYHEGEVFWADLPPCTVGYKELDGGGVRITCRANEWDKWFDA